MTEGRHRALEIYISTATMILGCFTIFFSVRQYSREEAKTKRVEIDRTFWMKQNEVYVDICKNAGTMAAQIRDPKAFEEAKTRFLSCYYGESILVEDSTVDKAMLDLKDYCEVFNPEIDDIQMRNKFKYLVMRLAKACKQSSATFKNSH